MARILIVSIISLAISLFSPHLMANDCKYEKTIELALDLSGSEKRHTIRIRRPCWSPFVSEAARRVLTSHASLANSPDFRCCPLRLSEVCDSFASQVRCR